MKYFYDLEFREDGHQIDFISIGIVAEDGREYYAVAQEVGNDQGELYKKLVKHRWLMENVISQLPLKLDRAGKPRIVLPTNVHPQNPSFVLDIDHPNVLPQQVIAKQVKAFLTDEHGPVELWAWYGAYDHVRLMQLWGSMMARPPWLPMWTHDINQKAEENGWTPEEISELVPQPQGLHNALHDALRTRDMWSYLEAKL